MKLTVENNNIPLQQCKRPTDFRRWGPHYKPLHAKAYFWDPSLENHPPKGVYSLHHPYIFLCSLYFPLYHPYVTLNFTPYIPIFPTENRTISVAKGPPPAVPEVSLVQHCRHWQRCLPPVTESSLGTRANHNLNEYGRPYFQHIPLTGYYICID